MVEYMKEELEQLGNQRKRAKAALEDIETTISERKQSTGYKIHAMLERNTLNGVKKKLGQDMMEHMLSSLIIK